jgi:FkbM family methyltransferase
MRTGKRAALQNVLHSFLGANRFEPRMERLFSTLIRSEDTILDVGANIGCTTILFAQLAKRVVAFEPTPRTFRHWKANIAASGHQNVVGWNYALGAEEKSSMVAYAESNRAGAFVMDKTAPGLGATAVVDVKRLDDVMATLGVGVIDFMKLDVEGYEHRVIEGGWQCISRNRPVIQLELNSWCLNAQQRTSLPDFFDFLLERFPLAYAVHGRQFVDLRSNSGRWLVMRENILERRFQEMVVAFDADRLARFHGCHQQRCA